MEGYDLNHRRRVRNAKMTIKIFIETSSQKGGRQGVRKEGTFGKSHFYCRRFFPGNTVTMIWTMTPPCICVKWVPFVKLAFSPGDRAHFGPKMGLFSAFSHCVFNDCGPNLGFHSDFAVSRILTL